MPAEPPGEAIVIGDRAAGVREALPREGWITDGVGAAADLVAVPASTARSARGVGELGARVRPGGALVVLWHGRLRPRRASVERRLRRDGFTDIRWYWPRSTGGAPDLWLSLDAPAVRRWYLQHLLHASTQARRAMRATLRPLVGSPVFCAAVPAIAVIAGRGASGDFGALRRLVSSWLDEVPAERSSSHHTAPPPHLTLIPGGGGPGWRMTFLAWGAGDAEPALAVKMPRDARDNDRCLVEPSAQADLARWALPTICRTPRAVGSGMVRGRRVCAEEVVPGRPLLVALSEGRRTATDWLRRMQPLADWLTELAARSRRPATDEQCRAWFAPLDDPPPGLVDAIQATRLRGLADTARRLQHDHDLPAVFVHGDVGPPNVLVGQDDRLTGLVDWEAAGWGLPGADLAYFLARLGEEAPPAPGYCEAADAALADHLRRLGIASEWTPMLLAATYLHHASNEWNRSTRPAAGASVRRLRALLGGSAS
ncbi:MAG: aminoglycoside phosphotransferase family protein [Jatrophihabitans sp.]